MSNASLCRGTLGRLFSLPPARPPSLPSITTITNPITTTGADYKAGCDYFIEKFRQLNKTDREFYYHLTCATDTSNVKMVFNTCKDIILKNNLKDSGFL